MASQSTTARMKYQFDVDVFAVRNVTFETKSHVVVKMKHPTRPNLNTSYKSKSSKTKDYSYKLTHTSQDIDAMGIDFEVLFESGTVLKSFVPYGSTGSLGAVTILRQPIHQLWFPLYDTKRAIVGEILVNASIVENNVAYVAQGEYDRITTMKPGHIGSKVLWLEASSNNAQEEDYIYGGNAIADWSNKFSHLVDILSTSLNVVENTQNQNQKAKIMANIQYRRRNDPMAQKQLQMNYAIPEPQPDHLSSSFSSSPAMLGSSNSHSFHHVSSAPPMNNPNVPPHSRTNSNGHMPRSHSMIQQSTNVNSKYNKEPPY